MHPFMSSRRRRASGLVALALAVTAQPTDFSTPSQCAVAGGRLYTGFSGLRSYAPHPHHHD